MKNNYLKAPKSDRGWQILEGNQRMEDKNTIGEFSAHLGLAWRQISITTAQSN